MMFDFVTLILKFDLLLKSFNLGCYLVMVAARRTSLSYDNSYYPIDEVVQMKSDLNLTRYFHDYMY